MKFLKSLLETIETVAIAVAVVFVIRAFIAQPFLVSGSSMEPGFSNGDYLLVDELSYRIRVPERGEVIVFRYPGDHRSYYIKRIIGLPGERVVLTDGRVTVYETDGVTKVLTEPYIAKQDFSGSMSVTLKPDQYFMMGDNRDFSFDSRAWGPLDKGDIAGLVRFRLWPIQRAMAFSAPTY
jgi:signal peptidase I